MTRTEFMKALGGLLQDLPAKEREDALRYYGDYFNDAGETDDEEIIASLGTPEQVAEMIRNESTDPIAVRPSLHNEVIPVSTQEETPVFGEAAGGSVPSGLSSEYRQAQIPQQPQKKGLPIWAVVLITIACVILSPAILGLAITAVALVFSLIVTLFAVAFGMAIAFVVLAFVAAVLLTAGGSMLFTRPLAALTIIGAAFVLIGLCLAALVLTILLFGKAIPGLFRWFHSLSKKRKERKKRKKGGASL